MKIEYGNVTLGEDATGDVIEALGREHRRVVQAEDLAFSADPFTAGRGNRRNTVRFRVTKTHAASGSDTAEHVAAAYYIAHPDALDDSATLTITMGVTVKTLAATLESVTGESLMGQTTIMNYSFTGGQFTAPQE